MAGWKKIATSQSGQSVAGSTEYRRLKPGASTLVAASGFTSAGASIVGIYAMELTQANCSSKLGPNAVHERSGLWFWRNAGDLSYVSESRHTSMRSNLSSTSTPMRPNGQKNSTHCWLSVDGSVRKLSRTVREDTTTPRRTRTGTATASGFAGHATPSGYQVSTPRRHLSSMRRGYSAWPGTTKPTNQGLLLRCASMPLLGRTRNEPTMRLARQLPISSVENVTQTKHQNRGVLAWQSVVKMNVGCGPNRIAAGVID